MISDIPTCIDLLDKMIVLPLQIKINKNNTWKRIYYLMNFPVKA